jgi:ADP-heptose:LPS heptosyltransferase
LKPPINYPLVQEVTDTFPNCKIDLFVKGNIAAIIFENYENIDSIIKLPKSISTIYFLYKRLVIPQEKQYDLVINVDKNSSSGRLSTKSQNRIISISGMKKLI